MKNKLTEIEMAIIRKKAKCHDWNWDKIAKSLSITNVEMVNTAHRLIHLGYTLLKPQNKNIELVKAAIDEHILQTIDGVSGSYKDYALDNLVYSVVCVEQSLRRLYASGKLKRPVLTTKLELNRSDIFTAIESGRSINEISKTLKISYHLMLNWLGGIKDAKDVPKFIAIAYDKVKQSDKAKVVSNANKNQKDCFKPNYTPPPVQKTPFVSRQYAPIKPKYTRQEEIILAYFERSIDECLRALYAEQYFLSIEEIEQIHQQLKKSKNAKQQS